MLSRERIERALDLQARGYKLLRWMEHKMQEGVLAPDPVGEFDAADAVRSWVVRLRQSLPPDAVPPPGDVDAFSNYFASMLTATFDLDLSPDEVMYSPGGHCWCPWCSWLVKKDHLRPRKPSTKDKHAADAMSRDLLEEVAADEGLDLDATAVDALVGDVTLREALAMATYVRDLETRMEGYTVGTASLVLWRRFAWTPQGSPKKKFQLRWQDVEAAQEAVREAVRRTARV